MDKQGPSHYFLLHAWSPPMAVPKWVDERISIYAMKAKMFRPVWHLSADIHISRFVPSDIYKPSSKCLICLMIFESGMYNSLTHRVTQITTDNHQERWHLTNIRISIVYITWSYPEIYFPNQEYLPWMLQWAPKPLSPQMFYIIKSNLGASMVKYCKISTILNEAIWSIMNQESLIATELS